MDEMIEARIRQTREANEWYAAYAEQKIKRIVPKAYRGGWDGYETATPEHARLKAAAKAWVCEFKPRETLGIRLGGGVGCGKTRLGFAIIEALIRRGIHAVSYVNSIDLFAQIRNCFDSPEHHEADLFAELLNNDVLFIDDLGTESGRGKDTPDYVLERLYLLLDRAIRDSRPTMIVSSNLGLSGLAKIYGPGNGERIASRLTEMTELLGEFPRIDMRIEKQKRQKLAEPVPATSMA